MEANEKLVQIIFKNWQKYRNDPYTPSGTFEEIHALLTADVAVEFARWMFDIEGQERLSSGRSMEMCFTEFMNQYKPTTNNF